MNQFNEICSSYTSIFFTKLDILDALPSIKVCIGYCLNGKKVDYLPSSASNLNKIEPIYEEFDGWLTSTEAIRSFDDLPSNAQKYVRFVEDYLDIPSKNLFIY